MKLKKIMYSLGSMICSLALVLGASSVKGACLLWFYQPKVPEGMKKYVKK